MSGRALAAGHSSSIDWWELGIFLHEMVFGTTPFRASRREQTFHNIINQPLTFPATPAVSPELRDLVTKLLMRDPSQRLGTQGGAEKVKAGGWRSEQPLEPTPTLNLLLLLLRLLGASV